MNSRERVLAAVNHEMPDRVPIDVTMTPPFEAAITERLDGTDPWDHFDIDVRRVRPSPTRRQTDFGAYLGDLPPGITIDEWGMGQISHGFMHYTDYAHPMAAFASPAEVEEYPFPDLDAGYRYENLPAEVSALHDRGLAVVGSCACTIFERSWYLRGMERMMIDMSVAPDFAEALFDRVAGISQEVARRLALAGVDVLELGDDIGTQHRMMMSPGMWRRWFKPRMARIIEAAKDAKLDLRVLYHSDGYVEPVIKELIEIGVDILNPVQPECMDPAGIRGRFGRRLAQWGTIGTQTTFPFGTPEQMRATVRERIATAGPDGLVLAPTHALQPDVPYENFIAFLDAAREYRL